jgi:predicted DNA-binding transcriptional regulator AlpA
MSSESILLADFIDTDELARQLGKPRRSIVRWMRLKSGPPPVHVGRTTLFRRSTVLAWLRDQEKKHAAPAASSTGRREP